MKVEGRNAVTELLGSDADIDKILVQKEAKGSLGLIAAKAREKGVKVRYVEAEELDRASSEKRHQGVIAYVSDFSYSAIEDIVKKEEGRSLVILCDCIEDVHNLGAIIRVAECVGSDGVVIPRDNSASVTGAVVRISAGAASHEKVARCQLRHAIDLLKDAGYWVYALEADGESIYGEQFPDKCALVIGGEDTGVRKSVRAVCDKTLSLPLRGEVSSLNASVALAVAAYEVTRKW